MNLRNLFRVSGAFLILVGLVWILAPKAMPASYGQDMDSFGAYFLQQLGATNVAIGVLLFLVSGMTQSPARQAVVTFMVVLQVLSLIVSLYGVLSGVVPGASGWLGVAFNCVFAAAFGYFRFIRPETSMTPQLQP